LTRLTESGFVHMASSWKEAPETDGTNFDTD
jgi:hypothetical protein